MLSMSYLRIKSYYDFLLESEEYEGERTRVLLKMMVNMSSFFIFKINTKYYWVKQAYLQKTNQSRDYHDKTLLLLRLHESLGNWVEAAYTILLHTKDLSWTGTKNLSRIGYYPAETESERMVFFTSSVSCQQNFEVIGLRNESIGKRWNISGRPNFMKGLCG